MGTNNPSSPAHQNLELQMMMIDQFKQEQLKHLKTSASQTQDEERNVLTMSKLLS
jgi:hypothetical protein